ncbi:hypothetical protein FEF26_11300 [Nesterenkonia salmonea]|uniref:DUF4333 domain-containing protein n=1 Tax=Nesterenkonia salmonea TaxID=1804987 RepID=A0A5R9B8Z1_9MICC|nr:hypothetical protein [Nesterenkonia salmonea]TLP94886.1 hypothetical protein FEF26_11300 [Nesterenkonia salmonea]
MNRKSLNSAKGLFFLVPALLVVASCGEDASETTFDSVDELTSSMQSEGLECNAMDSTTYETGTNEVAEQVLCVEGHSLTVWEEGYDADDESSETDPLVREMEEQGTIEHLRGANWHVMSINGDLLDELHETFGGQRNEQDLPDFG